MARDSTDYVAELEKVQLVVHSWTTQLSTNKYTNELLNDIADLSFAATVLVSTLTAGVSPDEEPEVTVVVDIDAKFAEIMSRYMQCKTFVTRMLCPTKLLKRSASDGADEGTGEEEKEPVVGDDVDDDGTMRGPPPKRARPSSSSHESSQAEPEWDNTCVQPL